VNTFFPALSRSSIVGFNSVSVFPLVLFMFSLDSYNIIIDKWLLCVIHFHSFLIILDFPNTVMLKTIQTSVFALDSLT
jgi:hypothetical protein